MNLKYTISQAFMQVNVRISARWQFAWYLLSEVLEYTKNERYNLEVVFVV